MRTITPAELTDLLNNGIERGQKVTFSGRVRGETEVGGQSFKYVGSLALQRADANNLGIRYALSSLEEMPVFSATFFLRKSAPATLTCGLEKIPCVEIPLGSDHVLFFNNLSNIQY